MTIRTIAFVLCLVIPSTLTFGGDQVEFNRDIRPILSENCYLCHGPDKNHQKAGLRLDDRRSALEKAAIVPGQPDASELVARIMSEDPDDVMPPPDSTKSLTAAQKDLLKRWVSEGANYQAHWAYEPIQRPDIPAIKDPSQARNPIDAFVLAALDSRAIRPSAEADRRTLIRRLSLDLIGLPPTPGEVAAFASDPSSNAYETLVDRLLNSPHYGERMAVSWLDLARFADTVGYHGDQNQHIFPYRDYVIDAFNRNLPFDRFTIEQLAGDLLPNPTPEQLVATGFNRLNMMTREGGAQPKEYLAKYAGDRVRTVAVTWLGSTMGCAECHDHKYDPFQSRDFYRMAAFFADVKQWGVYMDYTYTPNPDLRGFSNDHPFPPEMAVESPYLRRRIARLDEKLREVFEASKAKLDRDSNLEFEDWVKATRSFLDRHADGWSTPSASVLNRPNVAIANATPVDGSVVLDVGLKSKEAVEIELDVEAGWVASIRLELLPREDLGGQITVAGVSRTTIGLSARVRTASGSVSELPIFHADADRKDDRYTNGSVALGVEDGWRISSRDLKRRQTAVYLLDKPVLLKPGDHVVVSLKAEAVGCVRLSVSPLALEDARRPTIDAALIGAARDETRDLEQDSSLHRAFLLGTSCDVSSLAQIHRLTIDRLECRDGQTLSMITESLEPPLTRVLSRGNWQDESGEVVAPGVPGFLPQPPETKGRRLNRLDLARWLTSRENPLTARVFANRLWKQFFGTGLSAVMEDVGAQGEWPSHPELLDWLAVEFLDSGWDVKGLVKRIVMSATYRQDSRLRAELRESDPSNRLLASQSPRRLEAEFIRDNALFVSGLLNLEIGGPSSRPYQPPGYYVVIQFPERDYYPDRDDRQYRRGLYTHWQRTFLQPMLANFDAPSREECTASRNLANTPQQALTLLNDPTFVEAARVLAATLLSTSTRTDQVRLDDLFLMVLGRPIKPKEQSSLLAFLSNQRLETRHHPLEAAKLISVGNAPVQSIAEPAELAAWTEVCRVVLNLHESITRY